MKESKRKGDLSELLIENREVKSLVVEQVELQNPEIVISFFDSVSHAAGFLAECKNTNSAMIALNVEKLIYLQNNFSAYKNIENIIFYPDGAPICWLSKKRRARIPGVELWIDL